MECCIHRAQVVIIAMSGHLVTQCVVHCGASKNAVDDDVLTQSAIRGVHRYGEWRLNSIFMSASNSEL